MTALEMQIAEFASLGEVFDPCASESAVAQELAETLMRQPLSFGRLEQIGRLTGLVRILKLAAKMVTAERDLAAYAANAMLPYRRLAKLVGVHVSTMQGWVTAGRKVAESQRVPRGTESASGVENSNSNSELATIQ